jgi:hypothetical protein
VAIWDGTATLNLVSLQAFMQDWNSTSVHTHGSQYDLWDLVKECANHGVSVAVAQRWFDYAIDDVPWQVRHRIGMYDHLGQRRQTFEDWKAANPHAKPVTMAEAILIARGEAA